MTEPLTPEEARKTADDMDWSVAAFEASDQEACHIFYDRDVAEVAATLRAYADQAERLKEIEGVVGEWIAAQDAWPATVATAKATREALDRLEAADARLRSHLEKNHD